jgi:hypothetical protein
VLTSAVIYVHPRPVYSKFGQKPATYVSILRVVVGCQKGEHICTTDRARATRGWATALGCFAMGVLDLSFGFAAHAVTADI